MTTHIAVAVVERKGEFLVGVRPTGVPLAGYCEFPGGKVLPEETGQAAAVRECLEETGLVVEVVGAFSEVVHDYSHDRVRLEFFACRPLDDRLPRPPFRWCPREQLPELKFPEANAALVAYLTGQQQGGDDAHRVSC